MGIEKREIPGDNGGEEMGEAAMAMAEMGEAAMAMAEMGEAAMATATEEEMTGAVKGEMAMVAVLSLPLPLAGAVLSLPLPLAMVVLLLPLVMAESLLLLARAVSARAVSVLLLLAMDIARGRGFSLVGSVGRAEELTTEVKEQSGVTDLAGPIRWAQVGKSGEGGRGRVIPALQAHCRGATDVLAPSRACSTL